MKRLLRFLSGYVQIQIWGGEAGRFLNLCVRNQIGLWNLTLTEEDRYSCMLRRKDIWKLRPYLRKTHTHIRIVKKRGLPFFVFRYRGRVVFPVVFVAAACLFGYFSGFIWKIDVNGNSYVTREALISYLEENGVAYGTPKSKIDSAALSLALREDFDMIIWASVSVDGTDLVIEVQEKVAEDSAVAVMEESACYDIVASADAVIYSIITRTGTPCVEAGDEVAAGQVLVRGEQIVLGDDGETKLTYPSRADADIIGLVCRTYEDSVPAEENVTVAVDSGISGFLINVRNQSIELPNPLWRKEGTWKLWSYVYLPEGLQFWFPVSVGICTSYVTETAPHTVTQEEALSRAQHNLEKFLSELEENGVFIVEKNIIMEEEKNEYRISGIINTRESIVELVPSALSGIDTEETTTE